MDNVEKAAQPVLAKINRALAKPAMTDVELRQDASAEYVKGWNDGIAARKELDDLSAIDPVALVQAEIEKLREALKGIDVYGTDTLSGRVKPEPATYKDWLIEGVVEMRTRARKALGETE